MHIFSLVADNSLSCISRSRTWSEIMLSRPSPSFHHFNTWLHSRKTTLEFYIEAGISPPVKYFYWPFQGGASFVDHLCCFCFVFCYSFVRVWSLMPYGHLLGKGWPLGSCLWCLIVKLSLSHWYPGSGVVLDCIDPDLCRLSYFGR